jgi:hypothetical protein
MLPSSSLYHTVLPKTQRRDELATDHGYPREGNLRHGGRKEARLSQGGGARAIDMEKRAVVKRI